MAILISVQCALRPWLVAFDSEMGPPLSIINELIYMNVIQCLCASSLKNRYTCRTNNSTEVFFMPVLFSAACYFLFTLLNVGFVGRHEKYVTQYRAVFVVNCKMKKGRVSDEGSLKRKRVRKGGSGGGESFTPVCCSVCETEVGVIDDDEVYHFFNVLPSEC